MEILLDDIDTQILVFNVWSSNVPYLIVVNYGSSTHNGFNLERFMTYREYHLKIPVTHPISQRTSWELVFTNSNRRYDTLVTPIGRDLVSVDCPNYESEIVWKLICSDAQINVCYPLVIGSQSTAFFVPM